MTKKTPTTTTAAAAAAVDTVQADDEDSSSAPVVVKTQGGSGGSEKSRRARGIVLALCAGTCTATYSINDKVGVTKMDPAFYMVGMNVVGVSIELLYLLVNATRRRGLHAAMRTKKAYIATIGIGGVGCYLMILIAFTLSDTAALIVALRECSIVFGALFGFVFLGEPATPTKIVGILLITSGVLTIKWG